MATQITDLESAQQQQNQQPAGDWSDYRLVLTREYNAPRWMVFNTWIDPAHLRKWWGPGDFTNPVCEVDPQSGGRIYIVMRGPDGTDYPMGGEYREIAEPERLTFTAGAHNASGQMIFELLKTAVFEEREIGKTFLTITTSFLRSTGDVSEYLSGHQEGFTQSLSRLEDYLKERVAFAQDNARAPGSTID